MHYLFTFYRRAGVSCACAGQLESLNAAITLKRLLSTSPNRKSIIKKWIIVTHAKGGLNGNDLIKTSQFTFRGCANYISWCSHAQKPTLACSQRVGGVRPWQRSLERSRTGIVRAASLDIREDTQMERGEFFKSIILHFQCYLAGMLQEGQTKGDTPTDRPKRSLFCVAEI